MDLDIRTRGRPAVPVSVTSVGPIVAEDLPLLSLPRPSAQPPALLRLRDRHHRLAQHLANGHSERDAAIICGYDISRVSILKNDPAFKELLEFYRERQAEKFDGFADKLSTLANEAVDELIGRLENEEEASKMTVQQLAALTELGANRIGYGPQTRSENLNVNVGLAQSLEEARKRVAERRKTIDVGPAD